MSIIGNLWILGAALLVEAAIGYPPPVFRAVRHPVVWIGTLITWLDRRLNSERLPDRQRRLRGILALLVVLAAAAAAGQALRMLCPPWLLAVLASSLFAQRALHQHVRAVGDALASGGLDPARAVVAHIVGRNPASLDAPAVLRAAIESLAENFSDGVVAPAFWCAMFGLPGLCAYKAANTMDSMIGHRTPRHQAFGWAAARFDDLVNLPASRLSALWLLFATLLHRRASTLGALTAIRRDAGQHRSPNAGWPEAAMAGALGVRLAGPRVYGEARVEDAWIGGDGDPDLHDLRRALALYRTACGIEIAAVLAMAIVIARS